MELEFEIVGFEEKGKQVYPGKNLSEQRGEPTTNSTHIWRRRRDVNPGHIGGRRMLSPLRHHFPLPFTFAKQVKRNEAEQTGFTYKDKSFQYQPCLILKRLIRNKQDSYRVLNSCKSRGICAAIFQTWKKSGK